MASCGVHSLFLFILLQSICSAKKITGPAKVKMLGFSRRFYYKYTSWKFIIKTINDKEIKRLIVDFEFSPQILKEIFF